MRRRDDRVRSCDACVASSVRRLGDARVAATIRTPMPTYTVEPTKETLHGNFSRDWPPILTIEHGDSVCFRTLDAGWGLEGPEVPRKHFEPRIPERGDGHALCGPIAIRGAQPGMMLEV